MRDNEGPRPNDCLTIIKTMKQDAGLSNRAMSAAMGRAPSYIGSVLYNITERGDSLGAETLADMAAAYGYRLVLVGHDREIHIRPRLKASRLGDTVYEPEHASQSKPTTANGMAGETKAERAGD